MRRFESCKACLGIFVMLSAVSAYGQIAILTSDTQISSAAPSTNYGASPTLTVNATTSVLFRFDIADALPVGTTGAQIKAARLIVFPDSITTAGTASLYPIESAWTEGTVTFDTAPILGPSVSTRPNNTAYSPVVYYMTGVVEGWVDAPSTNNGVELQAVGDTEMTLDSKENTATSHPAVLEIELSGPAGPAGATGPTGPAGPEGVQGVIGAQGPQGLTGATGLQGPAGTNGANGQGFNFRNAFDPTINYNPYDVVTYNGSTYETPAGTPAGGLTPDQNPAWVLFAQAGAAGTPGATGAQGPQGPQGPQGSPGVQGGQGATGLQGPAGSAGANGQGFNFTGPFSLTTAYNPYDVTTYNGSTYATTVAIAAGGATPDQNPAWSLMAQAGAPGAAGAQGSQGPQGLIGLTGPQGSIGPTGLTGATGLTGPQGPAGPSGASGALATVPYSATPIFDASQGTALEITLTGNVTSSTLANATAGQTFQIILCQDATGGRTFVPPANVQWSPIGTTTPGYCAAESFVYDGTTAWYLGPVAYSVSGPITNLSGSGLTLSLNGSALPVTSGASAYQFPGPLYSGQSFLAAVAQQPSVGTCTFPYNVGAISGANTLLPLSCVSPAGAPTNVVATGTGADSITVTWTPPTSNGGADITGYVITNNNGVKFSEPANSTSAILAESNGCANENYESLTACGSTYTFTVAATNSYGNGTQSSVSNAVGPPGPLQYFGSTNASCMQVTSAGNEQCGGTFTWTLPTNTGGSPLTTIYYQIYGAGSQYLDCSPGLAQLAPTATSVSTCYNGVLPGFFVQNAFGAISTSQISN